MKVLSCIYLLLFSVLTFTQVTDSTKISEGPSKKEVRKAAKKTRPTYIGFGAGRNFSKFRDFATSPLFYKGKAMAFTLSRLKYDDKLENNLEFTYSFGKYGTDAYVSSVSTIFLDYSQLYQINKWSSEKWNFKAGGKASANVNLRINPSFQNNQLGIDGFFTLFGSFKVTRNLTRNQPESKKFLFVKYGKSTRKRALSFQYNLGLLNNTLRNGYAYTDDSSVRNEFGILKGYEFKVFSGLRMSSALNYTMALKNKNEIMISYVWDAYKTGGSYDKFEMANHMLKFTFFFATK